MLMLVNVTSIVADLEKLRSQFIRVIMLLILDETFYDDYYIPSSTRRQELTKRLLFHVRIIRNMYNIYVLSVNGFYSNITTTPVNYSNSVGFGHQQF